MVLYHEMALNSIAPALKKGLQCMSRGEKGDDELIIKTDTFLDAHRPTTLKAHGVCRDNNIYAFLGDESAIYSIQTGEETPLEDFLGNDKTLLKLNVPLEVCYVSNLDLYDTVKTALKNSHEHTLKNATILYWDSVVPLKKYRDTYSRPEVMITRDILPSEFTVVQAQ